MWVREPFNGGCRYINEEKDLVVIGYYEAPMLESDCVWWEAFNDRLRTFRTAEAAMAAAEQLG